MKKYLIGVIVLSCLFAIVPAISYGATITCAGGAVPVNDNCVKNGKAYHVADTNFDYKISGIELNYYRLDYYEKGIVDSSRLVRLAQFYAMKGYRVDPTNTEDGFAPGVLNTGSYHPADLNRNYKIEKSERDYYVARFQTKAVTLSSLLRVIQFFNLGGYKVDSTNTEDGFVPVAPTNKYHPADLNNNYKIEDTELNAYSAMFQSKTVSLSKLLRVIQFFNYGGYRVDPTITEDGFAPGPQSCATVAQSQVSQLSSVLSSLQSLLNDLR